MKVYSNKSFEKELTFKEKVNLELSRRARDAVIAGVVACVFICIRCCYDAYQRDCANNEELRRIAEVLRRTTF